MNDRDGKCAFREAIQKRSTGHVEDVYDAAANGKPYYVCGDCSANALESILEICRM